MNNPAYLEGFLCLLHKNRCLSVVFSLIFSFSSEKQVFFPEKLLSLFVQLRQEFYRIALPCQIPVLCRK